VSRPAIQQPTTTTQSPHASSASPRAQRLYAFLITGDAELWPQIGAHLPRKLILKQVDSIDEFLSVTQPDQPAVVLLDTRGCEQPSGMLAQVQAHSSRFAILALDEGAAAAEWSSAAELGQIVAFVPMPFDAGVLEAALSSALDEVNARLALLVDDAADSEERTVDGEAPSGALRRVSLTTILCVAGVLIVSAAGFFYFRARPNSSPAQAGHASVSDSASPGGQPAGTAEEKVDALIEQAQRAMRDRHFIEPAEGSALALYRSALVLDPDSGEARQGLQRLKEVLLARVKSALDARQFDAALQALETVRSIDPSDARLPGLDERIAKLRDELGPAEIQAAIDAQNFDRATQLIDDAARAKSLSDAKLNQVREDLRRKRTESSVAQLVERIDARLQQDELVEPADDSAAYYINQARRAGASATDLQSQYRELLRRLTLAARSAIDQRRLTDADRIVAELRNAGAPTSTVAALQRDIGGARTQQVREQSDQSRLLDLARARLTEGSVVEPENDNALYYLDRLRSADPQSSAIAPLAKAIQTQILAETRKALDASQFAQAEGLLSLASGLGASTEMDALAERLRTAKLFASNAPQEVSETSLTRTRKLSIDYPDSAFTKKIEGTVEIAYTVTPKGAVTDIRIVQSNPPGIFDKAAIKAVSRLRYEPVVEGGKAVAVSTKILLNFRLAG